MELIGKLPVNQFAGSFSSAIERGGVLSLTGFSAHENFDNAIKLVEEIFLCNFATLTMRGHSKVLKFLVTILENRYIICDSISFF
jgi:hypothetical protein